MSQLLDNFMEIFSQQINSFVAVVVKKVFALFVSFLPMAHRDFLFQKKKNDQESTNVETESLPMGTVLNSKLTPEEAQKFDQLYPYFLSLREPLVIEK